MPQCVVFSTPGLIPIEAFTTFGVNAKPNSDNPFGYFGTGLKYAIAVCLREGCEVVLYRGRTKYTFYVNKEDFRGKDIDLVRMKVETISWKDTVLGRPRYHKLPFTLDLGKNWKLWQAFRELETNTRDENGETFLSAGESPEDDQTIIEVFGQRFVDEYHDRWRNFLKDGKTVREDEAIQVIDRPSKHVYYRGVRIMDLREEAEFTYNFLKYVELTEDRTAMYPGVLEMFIADHIAQSEDNVFVQRAMHSPRYEGRRLSFSYVSAPSRTWAAAASSSPNPTAKELAEKVLTAIAPTTKIIITIPKSEVTDEEKALLQTAVEEIFGTEIEVQDTREAA